MQPTSDLKTDTYQTVSSDSNTAPGGVHRSATLPGNVQQLLLVVAAAIAIASIGSHVLVHWLKIETKAGQPFTIGQPNGDSPAFLAGSSLASYGISWEQISTQLDVEIRTWGIAGGSPYEWEQFQKQVPDARTTFIVVSAYDLDEGMICDFRADLVPLSHTIETLRAIDADWGYSKHVLTQYPITWLRTLFPTLGRSRRAMGIVRMKVKEMIKPSAGTPTTEAGPTLTFKKGGAVDEYEQQRISDWSKPKLLGKLIAMHSALQSGQSFSGPKKFAFERMLRYADQRGRSIVVVLPVSATYSKEFMPPQTAKRFEDALTEVQRLAPQTQWLRLDQMSGLGSDDNFCDLVHMNLFGQKIATETFTTWLKKSIPQPSF